MQRELPNLVDERRFRRRDQPEQQQQHHPTVELDEFGRVWNLLSPLKKKKKKRTNIISA